MKLRNILSLFALCMVFKLFSQGCSDAGICNITKPYTIDSVATKRNAIEIGYTYGKGLEDVVYHNGYIAYTRTLKNNWNVNIRTGYNQASGSFGTLGRLSDVFVVFNKQKAINAFSSISPSFGIKSPLNAANDKINGFALPLDYQSSLGTFDALLGLDYMYRSWSIDAALQIPIWQINSNSYIDEYSASDEFPTTNIFRRKADVLLRSAYTISTHKWNIAPSAMIIYHVGNDTYEDVFGQRQTIQKAQGITVNASILTTLALSDHSNIHLNLATPLVVRKIRPDGLTRSLVASIAYNFKF